MNAVRADWSTGRPAEVPGSEHDLEVDLVVFAIGTNANPIIGQTSPLGLDRRGYIEADADLATSMAGVFAGGDIVTGAATVIEAMGAGRRAARSMAADPSTAITRSTKGATASVSCPVPQPRSPTTHEGSSSPKNGRSSVRLPKRSPRRRSHWPAAVAKNSSDRAFRSVSTPRSLWASLAVVGPPFICSFTTCQSFRAAGSRSPDIR